jgi:hypothetical protein
MNFDGLETFYIVGALIALTIAVLALPTLLEQSRRKSSKKKDS